MKFRPYSILDNIITDCKPNEIIVEIGSDTGNYSTIYLSQLAKKIGTTLHSVDIDNSIANSDYFNLIPNKNVIFYNSRGEEFACNVLPKLNVSIKCLLLDNFDFIKHNTDQIFYLNGDIYQQIKGSDWPMEFKTFEELPEDVKQELEFEFLINGNGQVLRYEDQYTKKKYMSQFNIEMNNHDSLLTHLKQMMLLLPYMSGESYIICDRTKYIKQGMYEGYYYGKNGLVIPYLLVNNYVITHELDDVVILKNQWCP